MSMSWRQHTDCVRMCACVFVCYAICCCYIPIFINCCFLRNFCFQFLFIAFFLLLLHSSSVFTPKCGVFGRVCVFGANEINLPTTDRWIKGPFKRLVGQRLFISFLCLLGENENNFFALFFFFLLFKYKCKERPTWQIFFACATNELFSDVFSWNRIESHRLTYMRNCFPIGIFFLTLCGTLITWQWTECDSMVQEKKTRM